MVGIGQFGSGGLIEMPYKSAKQRRYLHARKPKLARKWDREYGAKVGGGKTKAQKRRRRTRKRRRR